MNTRKNCETISEQVDRFTNSRRKVVVSVLASLALLDVAAVVAIQPSHINEIQTAHQNGNCEPVIVVENPLEWARAYADGVAAGYPTGRCPQPGLTVAGPDSVYAPAHIQPNDVLTATAD